MKKSINTLLVLLLVTLLPQNSASAKQTYSSLEFVSGTNPSLDLQINNKSLNLDLLKSTNVRVRVKVNSLLVSLESQASISIKMYDVDGTGARTFVSSQSLNLNQSARKNRIISMSAGHFAASSKEVEFDVVDSENNLINTYKATLNASNIASQVSSDSGITSAALCGSSTALCSDQIDSFFEQVRFVPRRQRQASTRVVRNENGKYTVSVPVGRNDFKFFRGRRVKVVANGSTDNGGTGTGVISGFGEALDISRIRLGASANDYGNFAYDAVNGQIQIASGTGPSSFTNNFFLSDTGKLGIGVSNPQAYLHLRGGTATMPASQFEPGTLTTTPINGALEFDGNDLYFTKGGVRTAIGSGGPKGDKGDKGDTGLTGAKGDKGDKGDPGVAASIANGATLNGPLVVTANGSIQGDLVVNGNLMVNDEVHARLFNGDVFNGGIFRGDGSGLTNIPAAAIVGLPSSTSATRLDNGSQTLDITGTSNGTFTFNLPTGGSSNVIFPPSGTLATVEGLTPVAFDPTLVDINGINTLNVTGKNWIKVIDSAAATIDHIRFLTGGVPGQKVSIQLLANINFYIDNVGSANSIQWGRGTSAGLRSQLTTEIFEFVFDGNAWYLVSRYTL